MGNETLKSFDAQVWADDFMKTLAANPQLTVDRELMVTWFANALMRGYDEHYWSTPQYKRMIRHALYPWWSLTRYIAVTR